MGRNTEKLLAKPHTSQPMMRCFRVLGRLEPNKTITARCSSSPRHKEGHITSELCIHACAGRLSNQLVHGLHGLKVLAFLRSAPNHSLLCFACGIACKNVSKLDLLGPITLLEFKTLGEQKWNQRNLYNRNGLQPRSDGLQPNRKRNRTSNAKGAQTEATRAPLTLLLRCTSAQQNKLSSS